MAVAQVAVAPSLAVAVLLLHVGFDAVCAARDGDSADFFAGHSTGRKGSSAVIAGSMFAGRFRMVKLLHRKELATADIGKYKSKAAQDVTDPMPLPAEVQERFDDPVFIHAGTFGEVWKAQDTQNENRPVALKMFYIKDSSNESLHYPLTWRRARGSRSLTNRLVYATKECKLAKALQQFSAQDPVTASRLMRCYEDHTDEDEVDENDPIYQVYEYCGSQDLVSWIYSQRKFAERSPKEYVVSALLIFTQIVQVLHYLTRYNTRYCHHDLKPENIMVKEGKDGKDYIKLIDFGSMTQISNNNARKRSVSSPAYAEPTWFNELGGFLLDGRHWLGGYDAENPSSFDVYAASAILDELITGKTTFSKWKERAKVDAQPSYLNEMCKRQRLFSRLGSEDFTSDPEVTVSEALDRVKERYDDSEARLCKKWMRILHIKGNNGVEPRLTRDWGEGGGRWKDDARLGEKELASLIFCDNCVDQHFKGAVEQYRRLVTPYDWYPTFMSMMAFEPRSRPTPGTIMSTPLLKKLATLAPAAPTPADLYQDADDDVQEQPNEDPQAPSLLEEEGAQWPRPHAADVRRPLEEDQEDACEGVAAVEDVDGTNYVY